MLGMQLKLTEYQTKVDITSSASKASFASHCLLPKATKKISLTVHLLPLRAARRKSLFPQLIFIIS